jgi:hypothetical protein
MRPDYDDPIPKVYGLQIGEIVDRDDPEKMGRVRIRINGLMDRSNWAYPMGCPGGGSEDEGFFNVPPLGAEVAVFFKMGHPDHPYYMPANWGLGEAPENSDDGNPDTKVIALKDYDIVIDNRSVTRKFKIVDKNSTRDAIEFDGIAKSIKISSTSKIEITSIGEVSINGLTVLINGIPAGYGQL